MAVARDEQDDGRVGAARALELSPAHLDEWRSLKPADQAILTGEVLGRWTSTLADDDYTLDEIAAWERKRRESLSTLRTGPDLTDREFAVLRYLQRHEGRNVSYLMLARHLWSTPTRPITPRLLRASVNVDRSYAAPMVNALHQLVYHIRKKIEVDPLRPQHIASIRGVGYRWYSRAPSLDDGENYARRAVEIQRDRHQMQRVLGLTEGEWVAVEEGEWVAVEGVDRDGNAYETRVALGPEYPGARRQLDAEPEGAP